MAFFVTLDRALNRLYSICGYIACALLISLAALVLASIITRLFSAYIGGLNESAGYVMAGCNFLALAFTFRADGHIRVAMFISRFHGRLRRGVEIWCLAVMSFIAGYLAFFFVRLTYFSWKFAERSEGADAVLLWIPQSIATFGAIVFAICALHLLVKYISDPTAVQAAIAKQKVGA